MSPINKTQAPAPATGISLAPSTFVQGGGLLDDADVEIVDAAFVLWDYDGKVTPAVPALGLSLRRLDNGEWVKDEKNKETGFEDHEQYYSCGSAEYFVPNDEGTGLKPVADKTALVNSTNGALVLASLVNVGVPEDLLASGNIKDLCGVRGHVARMEQPKKGNKQGFQADPNKKQEVLVFTKLISLPGEAKAAAPVSKVTSAPKPPAAAPKVTPKPASAATATTASPSNGKAPSGTSFDAENELHLTTASKVLEVLAGRDGNTILRKDLAPAVFKTYEKGDKEGAAAMKLAFDEGFLKSGAEAGMGWAYDGTTVSIG